LYPKLTKRKATVAEKNDKHHDRNKGGPDPGGVPANGQILEGFQLFGGGAGKSKDLQRRV
jgi:hypothetical protein